MQHGCNALQSGLSTIRMKKAVVPSDRRRMGVPTEAFLMRLDLDLPGIWIVDPEDVAQRIGVSATALKRSINEGTARVLHIPGSWMNAGSARVTVHLHDGGWQGTFDQSGQLVAERVW